MARMGGGVRWMEVVSPVGPVYQAGTLSGNPLAVAAGLATLRTLIESDPYGQLESSAATIADGLRASASNHGIPLQVNRTGSMLTAFFGAAPVSDYASAVASNTGQFATFFHAMLQRGVYLPPSQFEAWFVSVAHTEWEISHTFGLPSRQCRQLLKDDVFRRGVGGTLAAIW
ncbi:MAG: glutamate-1-semialdehyde 2,1-aminomutase [Chlorobi bacterium OLB7]|nr:MAG: glutamate-1-semialdehyde 2,1-aminomutase [Chlorobi bacterium OLB7]